MRLLILLFLATGCCSTHKSHYYRELDRLKERMKEMDAEIALMSSTPSDHKRAHTLAREL